MIRRLRQRLGREEGFTIVESLVAALVLALGSLAVALTFVSAIHNVQRSRESQFGISIAQREMEWVRAHDFADIALTTTPAAPTDPGDELDPLDRVLPGQAAFSVNRREAQANTSTFKNAMPLVDDIPTGFDNTKEVRYLEGDDEGTQVQATVYRFVMCEEEVLPTNCDSKRIVIDVVPKVNAIERGRRRNYFELQSTIVNPALTEEVTP
jgi:Tfp pilus assembly protein PilV